MENIRKTEDYIIKDREEELYRIEYQKYDIDSRKYRLAERDYEDLLFSNRGIQEVGKKYILDKNQFAQYLSSKRLFGVIVYGKVHIYNKKIGLYEIVDDIFLAKCMKTILEEASSSIWSSQNQRSYMEAYKLNLDHIVSQVPNPNKLVLKNGILDIDEYSRGNKVLSKFTRKEVFFNGIPQEYDMNATCPIFIATLNDIFNNDQEIVASFQEMLGYILYYGKASKIQKFFVFYGKGSNGKSLLCNIIRKLIGDSNCSSTYFDKLGERFGLESMYRKMVNISPEAEQKKLIDSKTIKALCGGDTIDYEFKNKAAFSGYNYTKLIVCTNHPFKSDDTTEGFFRRLHIFPFENRYVELKEGEVPKKGVKYMDKELEDKLTNELSGILNFALEGLSRLINNEWKMTRSERIEQIQLDYYNEANSIELFVKNKVEFIKNSRIGTSETYRAYIKWFNKFFKKDAICNNTEFHRVFRAYMNENNKSYMKKEINGKDYYKGIRI